jgi:hypothetical protein
MGVAGAAAAGCSAMGLDAGVSSFLLQAASASNAHNATTLTAIAQPVFLFMMSSFLGSAFESKS